MSEMTPTEIDRKIKALCGPLLEGTMTPEQTQEMEQLITQRINGLCRLPEVKPLRKRPSFLLMSYRR